MFTTHAECGLLRAERNRLPAPSNNMIGKTRLLRRTELLLRVYYNKQDRERFGSSEYFRLQSLIDPLRVSYLTETGMPYVHSSEHSVRIEPVSNLEKRDGRLRI